MRPNCRCEDNIKTDIQDIGCECVAWVTITRYNSGSCEKDIAHMDVTNGKNILEYLSDY